MLSFFEGYVETRSDAFKGVFVEMLREARLLFNQCDCKHNLLFTARLEAAGAVNTKGDPVSMALGRSRVVDGGDMLVRGLFLPGDEVVIDFTLLFSERTVVRVDASLDTATGNQARRLSLAEVENRKVGLYRRMYDTIKVSVLGLAINLAGEWGWTFVVKGNPSVFGDCGWASARVG